MSMSVSLHTKSNRLEVSAKLRSQNLHNDEDKYVAINIASRSEEFYDYQEVTIFPSFEQVKQLHKELSKLMKEIKALDKRTKAEIHANSATNSKAQKFSQMVDGESYPF